MTLLVLILWMTGVFFTYGFCAEPGKKPTVLDQLGAVFVTLFIWPLMLGLQMRSVLERKKIGKL